MLFRVVALLFCLTGCAEAVQPQMLAMNRPVAAKRAIRVIGTERDMTLAGQQYCHARYRFEYTSWDKTEGLITCD